MSQLETVEITVNLHAKRDVDLCKRTVFYQNISKLFAFIKDARTFVNVGFVFMVGFLVATIWSKWCEEEAIHDSQQF